MLSHNLKTACKILPQKKVCFDLDKLVKFYSISRNKKKHNSVAMKTK